MAFEQLVRRYQRPLFGFIRRQVPTQSEADDLYQQALLRIFDRIDSCRQPEAFKAWAFGIAANVCRYEGRQQLLHRKAKVDQELTARAGWAPTPEETTQKNQLRERIVAAVHQLSPQQREVFLLYQYSQLDYGDIAQALSIPLGTVKSRMNAALNQLRDLLAGLREESP